MAASSKMDVDHEEEPPMASVGPGRDDDDDDEQRILVHPLAVVNMSDQFTRIRCGGSPLPPDAPATGLLFGSAIKATTSSTKASSTNASKKASSAASATLLEIRDAEDIPVDLCEAALLQEGLHRAVFPSNRVVGWYRVSDDDQITESDVVLTQQLDWHYSSSGASTASATGGGASSIPFVFALLVITNEAGGMKKSGKKKDAGDDDDDDDDDDDAPLPLSLYRLDSGALRHLPDWTLQTLDPERIAVERVLREQQQPPSSSFSRRDARRFAAKTATAPEAAGAVAPEAASLKPPPHEEENPALDADDNDDFDSSRFVQHTYSLEKSLNAIHKRLEVLRNFLEDTASGRIPYQPSLLRKVNALMVHASSITRPDDASTSSTTTTPLIPLAHLIKTVDSVRQYAEKFRIVHENTSGGGSSSSTTGAAGTASAASAASLRPSSSRIRERELKGF